jgi:transposase, IS6 family
MLSGTVALTDRVVVGEGVEMRRRRHLAPSVSELSAFKGFRFPPEVILAAAREFFSAALGAHGEPAEVVTDRAPALKHVIEELLPAAFHNTDKYANNRAECDHGRLKARLHPMRGLKTDRTAQVIVRGHALMQNICRGHYQLGVDARNHHLRVAAAFDELAAAI